MGFFDKLKGKKETIDWSKAHTAKPRFYGKPNGSPFGAIALTEGTETILPQNPQKEYKVDGMMVSEWKIVLVSTTKDAVIGAVDYFSALKKLEKYTLAVDKDNILVKGLSLKELETLIK